MSAETERMVEGRRGRSALPGGKRVLKVFCRELKVKETGKWTSNHMYSHSQAAPLASYSLCISICVQSSRWHDGDVIMVNSFPPSQISQSGAYRAVWPHNSLYFRITRNESEGPSVTYITSINILLLCFYFEVINLTAHIVAWVKKGPWNSKWKRVDYEGTVISILKQAASVLRDFAPGWVYLVCKALFWSWVK